jgi:hypothetical protein
MGGRRPKIGEGKGGADNEINVVYVVYNVEQHDSPGNCYICICVRNSGDATPTIITSSIPNTGGSAELSSLHWRSGYAHRGLLLFERRELVEDIVGRGSEAEIR